MPANTYSALTPQDADQKAIDDINAHGQTAANSSPNGTCLTYSQLFKNVLITGTFTKYCEYGKAASSISYTVPAGAFASADSQQEADRLATVDFYHMGQAQADNQTCNDLQMQSIQVSNSTNLGMKITFSYSGGSTTYTVPAHENYGTMSVIAGQSHNVTITAFDSGTYHFYYGSQTATPGSSATFSNVQPASISIN